MNKQTLSSQVNYNYWKPSVCLGNEEY